MEGDFIKIYKPLLPLSWLYGLAVRVRNLLFDMEVLKSRSFSLPVISVGNITVGGAGKTPHVEYLIRLLQPTLQVAVLSRGYKRQTKGYRLAVPGTTAADIGDEPFQMYTKYGGTRPLPSGCRPINVAVDANRCEGIDRLQGDKATSDTQVVLLDDAFQHRYVKPGLNILLVDFHRLIIYDRLLPAGRLREPQQGKNRADIVIITKCPKDLRPMDFRVISKSMSLYPYQKLFFTTLRYGNLRPVYDCGGSMTMQGITTNHHLVLLTGIASPQQLLLDLGHLTPHITQMSFADHHRFRPIDAARISNLFDSLPEPRIIITTEKDAARLQDLDGLSDSVRRSIYALPIEVEFLLDQQQQFDKTVMEFVKSGSQGALASLTP